MWPNTKSCLPEAPADTLALRSWLGNWLDEVPWTVAASGEDDSFILVNGYICERGPMAGFVFSYPWVSKAIMQSLLWAPRVLARANVHSVNCTPRAGDQFCTMLCEQCQMYSWKHTQLLKCDQRVTHLALVVQIRLNICMNSKGLSLYLRGYW